MATMRRKSTTPSPGMENSNDNRVSRNPARPRQQRRPATTNTTGGNSAGHQTLNTHRRLPMHQERWMTADDLESLLELLRVRPTGRQMLLLHAAVGGRLLPLINS